MPSMPSTSDMAKQKLLEGTSAELPMLVLCDQQTSGRGQPGRSWHSNSQSLTFTWCVAAESIPSANHALLPLIAGLSVCDAVESIGVSNAKLKWPNDILIDRQKVCGILVEKISSNNQTWFLIGIGVNVSQTADELELMGGANSSFPPGSLRLFVEKEIPIQLVLQKTVQHLQENMAARKDWPQLLADRFEFLGESIEFSKADGVVVSGIFLGIDVSGQIKIEIDGKTHCFTSGQLGLPQE